MSFSMKNYSVKPKVKPILQWVNQSVFTKVSDYLLWIQVTNSDEITITQCYNKFPENTTFTWVPVLDMTLLEST